jgi:predicted nucleic acid-binding protein
VFVEADGDSFPPRPFTAAHVAARQGRFLPCPTTSNIWSRRRGPRRRQGAWRPGQARHPRPVTRGVLWDSSAILALLDADDADHARAAAVARQIASESRPSFVTNCIEVEAHALLVRKLGRAIARQWLLTGGLPVVRALLSEEERAREILARHTDKGWSLCDAISFAVLETRDVSRAFTFDHHFRQYGKVHVLGLKR